MCGNGDGVWGEGGRREGEEKLIRITIAAE